MISRISRTLICGLIFLVHSALGQTLNLSNDSQTYATLANTTVTMTGRSELRITGTGTPLSGSIIHLNSPDAWLFMTQIRPSVVNSSHLSQIRVNGAAAALNTNCRIVQYGSGTVVIPHASSHSPLQVFSGSHFTGNSASLLNYTAYNDSSLGSLANQISSFKLKRGYTATIAQNANGTGISKNYVAQDGDIEVSVLPSELNDSVSFIRIFPWRWVGKKGSCDIAPETLDAHWHYNWDNNRNSPLDWEYVPIRQQRWWPAYPDGKRDSTHVLGYNEPDNPVEDSYQTLNNGSVAAAISAWPELLNSGMRLGSPAVTDGGESWLYNFIDQADAADLRVDFVAIHFYRCGYSASQLYTWLYNIHVRTGRKLWVTEFNNGANWTSCADPTLAQNSTAISSFIDMMDNAPFIERYAVYSAVEDVRRMVSTSGTITPAGESYRANSSPTSYSQEIPEIPTAPNALYQFENNTRDSSAYGHPAMLKGNAKFTSGKSGQAVVMSGVASNEDHVQLSTRIGDSTDFTFGAWVYWTSASAWQRIFDLGSSTNRYMFLTPDAGGSGNVRFAIKNDGAEQQLNHSAPLPLNTWSHVAVTINGNTGKLFINGSLVATQAGMTLNPSDLATNQNFLGKSQFVADPLFAGRLDDVQFLPYALSDAKIAAMGTNIPPQFTNSGLTAGAATQAAAYNGSIAGTATDSNAGDSISYSKADGPQWLNVASNGTLSGTPSFNDNGTQTFIIYATDSVGGSTYTTLSISLPNTLGNGTWNTDQNGTWTDTTKWSGSFPANGIDKISNFNSLDITADRTVTLDSSRSIGTLRFGDSSGTQSWILTASPNANLTLATSSGTPQIIVNQNTVNLNTPLLGTAGFTKGGSGTLILSAENPVSGTLNIDTGSSAANEGALRLAHPKAAASITSIFIRSNNNGRSTLELDGTPGGISCAAPLTLSGRSGANPAILNLAGNNSLSGAFNITSGGTYYILQSDAGTLSLTGNLSSLATGSRTLNIQGSGETRITGILSDGSADTGLGITKSGSGLLTLTGNNSHSGPTTINGGTITLSGAGTLGTGPISLASGTTLNLQKNLNLTQAVTGSGAIYNSGSHTITGDFSNFNGSYTHDSNVVSTAFNSLNSTGRNTAYHIASPQGASQGMIFGLNGDSTQEMGSLSGIPGSLIRGGNVATGTTTLQVGNLNRSETFAGSISNGATKTIALAKVGSGVMTLSGTNTHTGPTTVRAGTLHVTGSITASAVTVASSAILSGNGNINSTLTIQSGGTLAPGDSLGKLTVNANANLLPGSTTRMEINKSTATHDQLSVTGTLSRGGSLIVTHSGPPLAAGDSFSFFETATLTGAFSSISLPSLAPGLAWDTSTGRTFSVISTASPFELWTAQHPFPAGENSINSDPDADGIANAIEWLLGSDPLHPDPEFLPQATARTLSTTEFPAAIPGQRYLTMTARIRKSHPGMLLIPQAANSLETLNSTDASTQVTSFTVNDLGDFEIRTWVHTQAISESPNGRAFMRLKLISE